jgi:hypothetical protein
MKLKTVAEFRTAYAQKTDWQWRLCKISKSYDLIIDKPTTVEFKFHVRIPIWLYVREVLDVELCRRQNDIQGTIVKTETGWVE